MLYERDQSTMIKVGEDGCNLQVCCDLFSFLTSPDSFLGYDWSPLPPANFFVLPLDMFMGAEYFFGGTIREDILWNRSN